MGGKGISATKIAIVPLDSTSAVVYMYFRLFFVGEEGGFERLMHHISPYIRWAPNWRYIKVAKLAQGTYC
jgi:hypothetical protein